MCSSKCKSSQVAHFIEFLHVEVAPASFSPIGLQTTSMLKKKKKAYFLIRREVRTPYSLLETWMEIADLGVPAPSSKIRGWLIKDARIQHYIHTHISYMCFVLTNVQDLLLKCFWREKRFICTRADHCTNEFRICCQNALALLTQADPSHRSHIIYVIFISTKEKNKNVLCFIQNAYKDKTPSINKQPCSRILEATSTQYIFGMGVDRERWLL